jgi:preprotein translocase subunit SecD
LLTSCAPFASLFSRGAQASVEDGFYRVIRTASGKKDVFPLGAHEQVIRFSPDFRENNDEQTRYLVIKIDDFVPMQLAEPPQTELQPDQRKKLLLSLSDQAKAKLTSFTREHLNQLTAIVVGGHALTLHKVRTVIDGGKLQITRCTDNACEKLYVELKDNVD